MQALLGISRWIDRINAWIGKGVIWLILASVLVSTGTAILSKLAPTYATNALLELRWYLFGGAFMGAAAFTLQQNEHVRIDVFYAGRSRRTQHWIDLLGHIFFLLPFVILMAWLMWSYLIEAMVSGQGSANAGGLDVWPARAMLFAGFVMLCAQAVAEIIKKIAVMTDRMEDPHPFVSAQDQALQEAEDLAADVRAHSSKVPE